ncbi:hypothetical protein [Methylobacter sp.]|uniref:hypothetical protein n=1 Tax=Methylobacter sp. TaxID=2051955 RepID=UPI00121C3591|nr:hypothetical protein [Methylobacter sp.]TAK64743.1 MAG: hypothetical protein EPO18_02370 [Methylobacter sp.]
MKSILTYLAVLTLSFNVFAVEVQEEPKITAQDKIELNRENSPDSRLATHIVSSHTIPQASAEKPSEFITSLSVYLIIIIVYTIYGIKANSKNVGN